MESKQPYEKDRSVKCWFDMCEPYMECRNCVESGLHYLVQKVFINKTCIPLAYWYSKLEDLTLDPEANKVVPYILNIRDMVREGQGFYAYGGSGTGKTSIGCIALKTYLYYSVKDNPYDFDNRRVLYLNVIEFLDRVRKSFNSEDLELEQLLEELTNIHTAPSLILFDDLGAEKTSEWVIERLYSLVNFRVANGLSSIFTSNCDIQSLERKLGERLVSRIKGCAKPILFTNNDHRKVGW